jgi:hypothetical protein
MLSAADVGILEPSVERLIYSFWTLHDLNKPSDHITSIILKRHHHFWAHAIPSLVWHLSQSQQKLSDKFIALILVLLSKVAQAPAQYAT